MRSDILTFCTLVLLSMVSHTIAVNNQTLGLFPEPWGHKRVKRKVVFTKNSKIFFRVNGKLNVIPYVQIFAYGYAVRVNWELPESLYRRRKFFKRDLHTELEKIQFDRSEHFQTYACLFSYICNQISRISTTKDGKCGIMCSVGRIISQSTGIEADFFKSIINKCSFYKRRNLGPALALSTMLSLSYTGMSTLTVATFLAAILSSNPVEGLRDTSHAFRERHKRTILVYQPGLNWAQIVMGIGLPIEIQDNSITMGAVVKSYYEIPNNVTQYTNPSIDIERKRRRRRRAVTPTRWEIYYTIQHFIRSFGFADGKSCLLNSICGTSQHRFDPNGGLLGELLHLLLTPSSTFEDVGSALDREFYAAEIAGKRTADCQHIYPCETNLLEKFTQLIAT